MTQPASSSPTLPKLAYSAPGKALLAGGYLVLVPEYSAYVVALSARMHALIEAAPSTAKGFTTVSAASPQFAEGKWKFQVTTSGPTAFLAAGFPGFPKNPFLESTISVVLSYLQPAADYDLNITIFSDDGYHSQDYATTGDDDGKPTRFHKHTLPIHKVPKTGLGSSAALTTVVTAALVGFYRALGTPLNAQTTTVPRPLDPARREDLELVHNLAQLAHCTAQGKIGSGFDVAAATFGSIVYRRFPAGGLAAVADLGSRAHVDRGDDVLTYNTTAYMAAVRGLVDAPHTDAAAWAPLQLEPCSLPRGVSVLMGDVRGGSETPKLVSTVLQWRRDHPEQAAALWASLNAANMSVVAALSALRELSELDPVGYDALLKKHAGKKIDDDGDLVAALARNIAEVRRYLQQMTALSGVPIEPAAQTALLDRCTTELPGVIGGVVPGAGGYDAISLVVVSQSIGDIKRQSADAVEALPISWLELGEQSRGLVEEDFANPEYYLL